MKAYEFPAKITPEGKLELPDFASRMNSSADYKVCPGSIAGLVLIFSRLSSKYKQEKLLAIEYQEQELQFLRCDSRIAISRTVPFAFA